MDFQAILQAITSLLLTQVLPGLIAAIAIVLGGNWALSATRRVVGVAARRAQVRPALIDLLLASITGIGWVLIVAGVLQSLGLNQIALAVGGSISLAALGIASAASGNLGDIIAGVFLASDPDFGNGFAVKSGDISGVIERIDLRKTRIRAPDGKLHVVPNKKIENEVWIVEARPAAPTPAAPRPRRAPRSTPDSEPNKPAE
jgi:small-conductance mechanosensitive channel